MPPKPRPMNVSTPERPLKRKNPAGYIPPDMREAMDLPEGVKTVRQAMEAVPEVQEATEVVDPNGNVIVLPPKLPGVPGPALGVTHDLIRQRNERIVGLYMSGMTPLTILKNINFEAATKGWGELKDARSIKRIISQHYAAQRPSAKEQREHDDGMRDAMFEQQERLLEKAMLYFQKRESDSRSNPWKPFEYFSAIDVIARIRQTLIENRNWNASRMNPLVLNQFNATQVNVFDRNAQDVIDHQSGLQPIIALLDSYLEGNEPAVPSPAPAANSGTDKQA